VAKAGQDSFFHVVTFPFLLLKIRMKICAKLGKPFCADRNKKRSHHKETYQEILNWNMHEYNAMA
jgi:hypothetical protein